MDAKKDEPRYLNAFMSVWSIHKTGEPMQIILDSYWKSLQDFSIDQVEKSFGYALKNMQWFPKPVELRSFIEIGPGDIEDIATVEADKVVNAIRDIGFYKSVVFDDPVTMAVIAQGWGGWMKICEMRDDEIKWFRKDFIKIYKAYLNQGVKKYGHLVGFHEDKNLEKYPEHLTEPVLIGDETKAQKILEYKEKKPKLIEIKKSEIKI